MELFEPEPRVYTVSELNALAQELLETAFPDVWVEGELSNVRPYPSGHLYFTLKDGGGELDAVMFKPLAARLAFRPEDGQAVRARGTLTVYGPRGRYQLEVWRLEPAGLGPRQRALEALKRRLAAEGLFDPARKRPLPPCPERLGLITSTEGAAIRDVLSILGRRYPAVEVRIFPVRVQGDGAAEEIAHAIGAANRYHRRCEPLDVLIVGRGGGSSEDLWAFNEEVVARAIARSAVPVVSAVGHEVDVTLADLAADVRAPTPSAAAQLVVPDRDELLGRVGELARRLVSGQSGRLEALQVRLERLVSGYALRRPLRRLREAQQTLDALSARLLRAQRVQLERPARRLEALLARLEAVSPTAVLRRGYALVQDAQGRVVRAAEGVDVGQRLTVRLHRGWLECEVRAVELDR